MWLTVNFGPGVVEKDKARSADDPSTRQITRHPNSEFTIPHVKLGFIR